MWSMIQRTTAFVVDVLSVPVVGVCESQPAFAHVARKSG
jgi:hypothetical protein